MVKKFFTGLLLSITLIGNVFAEPLCLPEHANTLYSGTYPLVGYSEKGQWIFWVCNPIDLNSGLKSKIVYYVGTRDQLLINLSSRISTILRNKDPMKAATVAHNKYATTPITDPILAEIIKDMKKDPGWPGIP